MTNVTRFVYNFAANIFSTALSALLGLISIPFLIYYLGESQFGLTVLFSSLFGIAALAESGFNSAIIRKLSICAAGGDSEGFNKVFSYSMNIGMLASLVLTLLSALYAEEILCVFQKIPEDILPLARRAMWICILNSSITAFILPAILALFSTKHRFDIIAVVRSSIISLQVVVWYIVLSRTDFGFIGWAFSSLAVTVAVSILALLYGIRISEKLRYVPVFWDKSFFGEIVVVASKLSFIKISAFSMTYANPILFSMYGSMLMNTVFQTASKGTMLLYMVMINVSSQMLPHLAKDFVRSDTGHMASVYLSVSRIIFSLSVSVVALAFANYDYIFYLWLNASMPDNWLYVANVFMCLLVIQALLSPGDFQRSVLTVINKINESSIFYFVQTVTVICAVILLLKYTDLGVYSVVAVHLPVSIAALFFFLMLIKKYLSLSVLAQFRDIFLRGFILGALAVAVFVALRKVVDFFSLSAIPALAVNLSLDILIMLPALWRVGFSKSDRDRILSISIVRRLLGASSGSNSGRNG